VGFPLEIARTITHRDDDRSTGSAVRLSRDEVDYARPEEAEGGPTSRPIDSEKVIVGSVVKQESGRLTVMFPRDVHGLEDGQQLWRYVLRSSRTPFMRLIEKDVCDIVSISGSPTSSSRGQNRHLLP
jgi:hypothetical protein